MRPAKNHGPLTYEQLRHIGQHAMDNGAELSVEARLLLDNGHHARAFGLSVLAVEEAGKAFMCAVWAGSQRISTEASEWQPFWDHFKSHDAKYVWAVANWPDWGWNQDALRETERMAGERQENKWWSFYVDVHEGADLGAGPARPRTLRAVRRPGRGSVSQGIQQLRRVL